MEERKSMRVVITKEMHTALKKYAKDNGHTVSYVIREAVAARLSRSRIYLEQIHPEPE